MPRLLFDCTNVFWNPGVNSGIQRVVRNIVANLPHETLGYECVPVVLADTRLYRVLRLIPNPKEVGRLSRLYSRLDRLSAILWTCFENPHGTFLVAAWLVCRLARLPVAALLRLLRMAGFSPLSQRASPIVAEPDDHLVLLDSTWHERYFDQVESLKSKGLTVTAVIYDIIPLTHPEYFQARLRDIYTKWFNWVVKHADGFACISRAVRDEVRGVVEKSSRSGASEPRVFSYFHLGSDLDLKGHESTTQAELTGVFSSSSPVFLTVGTLEPRKNHGYLLDAFERLWHKGSEVRLCLVGQIGWKCEALVERIRSHPEYGGNLFWFPLLGDDGLEYAYGHADALVMSSHAEGFGLPIVEALQRGVPVMASDIPVFREVGGDFVAYFDLADPNSLVNLVHAYEGKRVVPGVRPPQEWRWIDWRDSAKQLVDGVISGKD
jgi:glycosyltransferase involved in cell wall biosynthesis